MSAAPSDPAVPDGIDEGKRLITLGGDKGLSLAERMAERFHRLTWRTPIHGLRLRGRHPLKLIAVPDDPFFGDVERGSALLEGRISYRGESHAIADLDLARGQFGKAFADYLHSFAWLRDLSSVTTRANAIPIAEAIMRRWLDAHADLITEPAWRGDLWGRRILFWTAHAPLILSSGDLVYRSRVLNTLARGARHLDRAADKAAPGASRIAAVSGLLAANLLIPGGDTLRAALEAMFTRAIHVSVYEDGGNVARSGLTQLDILLSLGMVRECYWARRIDPPAILEATIARMVPALLTLIHGDGALSSWQGAGPFGAERLEQAIEGSGVRARPLRQSRDWGYQRLASGGAVLVLDAAPPPIARVVEGGCASTLAFEFSDGPGRIVVNCGGARDVSAQVPASLADALRSTAAHSTLVIGDSNSTAIHADGTLGRGVSAVELVRQESEGASRIEASHDGYVRRYGFTHRRQLVLTADGRELRGEDQLLPAGRRRRGVPLAFAARFHLGRGVEVSPTADGQAALLRLPGGALWQFRCRGGALAVEESLWIDEGGRPQRTHQLVVGGEAAPGGTNLSWAFKRAV